MDLNDCGIDHDELRVGIARDCVEYPFKNIGFHPMTKAFEDRVPIPKISRQIPPGRSGACDPENGLEKETRIPTRPAGIRLLSQTMRFHLIPLGIRYNKAIH